jgi:ABC-type Fe3+ transport system permease subunit
MHTHNGMDLHGLLIIDYLFHLPLEVAGVVLALSFISLFRSYRSGTFAEATGVEDEALTGGAAR